MSKNISSKKIYAVVISYKSSPVLGDLYEIFIDWNPTLNN